MPINLTSTAFTDGATIPKQHTGDGADTSPSLHWSEPPKTTQSLALGASKDQVVAAMKEHVVGEGQLMGKYGR